MNQPNFTYLLAGIVSLLFSYSVAEELSLDRMSQLVIEPALCLTLLFGVWRLSEEKRWFVFGIIFSVIDVVLSAISFFIATDELKLVSMGILFLYCLMTMGIVIRQVLLPGVVDMNRIIGAICIYLLLGINWAFAYCFSNVISPNSFHGLEAIEVGRQLSELLYYSFVTITTLGYGDLTPLKPIARTLAYLEAVVGQFYVAVLVAGLVGMHLVTRQQDDPYGTSSSRSTDRHG